MQHSLTIILLLLLPLWGNRTIEQNMTQTEQQQHKPKQHNNSVYHYFSNPTSHDVHEEETILERYIAETIIVQQQLCHPPPFYRAMSPHRPTPIQFHHHYSLRSFAPTIIIDDKPPFWLWSTNTQTATSCNIISSLSRHRRRDFPSEQRHVTYFVPRWSEIT